jgi:hypothetical protein
VSTGGVISGATPGTSYSVVANIGNCTSDPSTPFSIDEQLESPTIEVTGNVSICEGTTTALTASGAASYLWDDPLNTTTAELITGGGTFTVTGTNSAGCSGTASVTVTETAGPTVDLGIDQEVCGEATVTVDAGAGFISYLWSDNSTGQTADLESGTHWVEVSDGSCTGSDTIVISANPNPEPTLSPSGAQVICDGGSLTLDAGSGFANYNWEPNGEQTQTINVTASGSYHVVVLDDIGCNGYSDTITVTIENLSDVTILADGPLGFCEGDSVTLDAGAGYDTYLWSNGATTQTTTVLATGDYSVSGTSNGCAFNSDTVSVSVSELEVIITADGVDLSVPSGYVSYQWFYNNSPVPGATTENFTATASGYYMVQVTDVNGCTGDSYTLEFTMPSSVGEHEADLPFVVYPNPSEGQFQLNTEFSDAYSILILNAVGQRVLEISNPQERKLEFNLETSGSYLLQVVVGETVYHKKLIVE